MSHRLPFSVKGQSARPLIWGGVSLFLIAVLLCLTAPVDPASALASSDNSGGYESLQVGVAGSAAVDARFRQAVQESAGLRNELGAEGYGRHLAAVQQGLVAERLGGNDLVGSSETHSISGRVTTTGGVPIANVVVEAYHESGDWTGIWTRTAADGTYTLSGLSGFDYIGTWNEKNYIDEWYDNVTRQGHLSAEGATLVDICYANVTGKDFQLASGRSISGKVTRTGGVALGDAVVEVCDQSGQWLGPLAVTSSNGSYTVKGVIPGSYNLCTYNEQNYVDEWYNNVIYQSNWDGAGATLVNIGAASATGKNFQLAQGIKFTGEVRGTVFWPSRAWVGAYDDSGEFTGKGSWNDGDYSGYEISGLVSDGRTYHLGSVNDEGYVDEWYAGNFDNSLRAGNDDAVGAMDLQTDYFAVFNLDRGCIIAGEVLDASTKWFLGADYLVVQVFNDTGRPYVADLLLSGDANYRMPAVPVGTYYLRTFNESGYVDEWYDDRPCTSNSIEDADPVIILPDLGDLTTANDFALDLAPPTITSLEPAFGSTAGGKNVVITGAGFVRLDGASAVTFDGEPATAYSVDASNQITAVTPAHLAGPVRVQVANPAGSSEDTAADDYTYMEPAGYSSYRGSDRFDTAIKLSQAAFPTALPADSGLVLAPGETFAEALCGAPLASAYGGPVLLTYKSTALPNNVKAEVLRLAPKYVFCIGLSTTTVNSVIAAVGPTVQVVPIGGTDPYIMSHNVAHALAAKVGSGGVMPPGTVGIITRGDVFPDAIGVSPLACAKQWPIILTNSTAVLPAAAAATITELGIGEIIKVGTYATPPAGVAGLANLSGADRYATNANVADWAKTNAGLTFTHTGLATGDKFPDALAAGPFLARDGGLLSAQPAHRTLTSRHWRPDRRQPGRHREVHLCRLHRTCDRSGEGALP